MTKRQRHETMRALALGARVKASPVAYNNVVNELEELGRTNRLLPLNRRQLFQSFHALRALETAMKEVLRGNGIAPAHSIGDLLSQLNNLPRHNPSHLNQSIRLAFHNNIRVYRNKIMHNANYYPTGTHDFNNMMAEIETCFCLIVK